MKPNIMFRPVEASLLATARTVQKAAHQSAIIRVAHYSRIVPWRRRIMAISGSVIGDTHQVLLYELNVTHHCPVS
jgi:hypothetical protein